MNDYHARITELFELLTLANKADSEYKEEWQRSNDANSRGGFYGHIESAIISIAGLPIVEYWVETTEVDLSLADRN